MKYIIFFLFFYAGNLLAGPGTTSANFLKFSQSARESSLAGAYSAMGEDVNSIFANPAGLANVKGKELSLGFTSYIQSSKMGMIGFTGDLKDAKYAFGLSALNIDGIERRGTIDSAGIVPVAGNFSSNDMALFLSYAKKDMFPSVMDNLNAGFTLKFINSKIDDSSAQSAAIDFGLLYNVNEAMNVSFMLANLGTKMKYEDESDNIPLNLRAGFLYKYKVKTNLSAEIQEYLYDEKFYPSLAIEHYFREGFALRAGYKFGYDRDNLGGWVGFTCGFGINVSGIGFNYAYVPFGDLGNVNRFDFQIKF